MHGPNQTLWSNKQIDSVVLCDCSVIGHRRFCSYLIFTSSVIFYWTDTLQYGIFLFNLYNNITKDKCYDVIYMPVLQYVMSENNARIIWFVLERPIDNSTCKLNGTESIFNLTRKVSDVSKQLVFNINTKVEPDFHQGHPIAQFKGVFVSNDRAFQLL